MLAILALIAFALVACEGGSASTREATTLAPTAAESFDPGPPEPEVGRIEEHISFLAGEIGIRTAGSPEERKAIDYAAALLDRWGYIVEVQPFDVSHDLFRSALVTADGTHIKALSFLGAPSGAVTAPLVDAGRGDIDEFPPEAEGAVVLIQRDDVRFSDMAERAQAAGARGVVVANRDPELFQGGFSDAISMPFVSIDLRDGDALRDLLDDGPVDVTLEVEQARTREAHNVIARPEGGMCRTLSGAHYDSVPVAPGANDNASGSATVLELARASAAAGLEGNCFALFGAEEVGLLGSAHLVSTLTAQEQDDLVAVFNYDVVAGANAVGLIGSQPLAVRADALADDLAIEARADTLPEGLSSDHVSFLDAGIPALMLTTHGFQRIHTARDTVANLEPEHLADIAALGFALLQEVRG